MLSEFTKRLMEGSNGFDFVAAHFACEKDRFSASNPNGFVNLGSAQNFLGKSAIQSRLQSLDWNLQDTPYREFAGTESSRTAVANYLQDISEQTVNPNHVVIGNGLVNVMEAIGIAILDAGDHVLVPTPVFPGLITALTYRTQASFITLETTADQQFQLSPSAIRAKLEFELKQGRRVKAVLLCSPGNPVGQVFTADEVQQFVKMAEDFNVALIVDEIYASSCFEGVDFVSALTANSDQVVSIGGLSKDFGLAGYTTSWACTRNEHIIKALQKQSHFFRLSAPIQRAIETFLEPEWRIPFLQSNRVKLRQHYAETCNELSESGVQVTPAKAGLVAWLDLRSYLQTVDEAGQLALYRYLLEQHRVHLSPASGFHCQTPGFFRICFSQEQETLREGLRRIQLGLRQYQSNSSTRLMEV